VDEDKFAVGSGAKVVSVCHFEEANNWWVSKMIKKMKSTVLSVEWHPSNNGLLATGCSDFKCRVFNAWVKGIDKGASPPKKFGEVLSEFDSNGWVHDVSWSPSGNKLAFVSHDSTVSVCDPQNNTILASVLSPKLPFCKVLFLSESLLVAGGFNFEAVAFGEEQGTWKEKGRYSNEKAKAGGGGGGIRSQWNTRVTTGVAVVDKTVDSTHQNQVTGLRPFFKGGDGSTMKFSSSSLDGKVFIYEANSYKK
jgi:actin related protein 2/3 complex subunit 1A/1B